MDSTHVVPRGTYLYLLRWNLERRLSLRSTYAVHNLGWATGPRDVIIFDLGEKELWRISFHSC